MKNLPDLQRDAREEFQRKFPVVTAGGIQFFLDELIASAYNAGKEAAAHDKSMTDIALAFSAGEKSGRNATVDYIEKEIWKRGTYDLNYDDIYKQARNAV